MEPKYHLIKDLFGFPNPVNEVAARMVAGMVMILTLAILLTDYNWLMFVLAYGFIARVLTGPKLCPMGQLATRVLAPLLNNKDVPGPPKRFAQLVGLIFSSAAIIAHFVFSAEIFANVILFVLVVFTALESIIGFCAGCFVFNYLMRWGLIPKSVCKECSILES